MASNTGFMWSAPGVSRYTAFKTHFHDQQSHQISDSTTMDSETVPSIEGFTHTYDNVVDIHPTINNDTNN
jgi:hypothetical protein